MGESKAVYVTFLCLVDEVVRDRHAQEFLDFGSATDVKLMLITQL